MREERLKLIEDTLVQYGRRHDDCEAERKAMSLSIQEIISWKDVVQESTEVNRRMVEVGEGILQALSWVGIMAKWISTVGAAFAAIWFGLKWILSAVRL